MSADTVVLFSEWPQVCRCFGFFWKFQRNSEFLIPCILTKPTENNRQRCSILHRHNSKKLRDVTDSDDVNEHGCSSGNLNEVLLV